MRLALILLATPMLAQVYPYSLIPGGTDGTLDGAEPAITAMYAAYDIGFLRPMVASVDTHTTVDYVKAGREYVTDVIIPRGELMYCDRYGHCVRARCANMLGVDGPREHTPPDMAYPYTPPSLPPAWHHIPPDLGMFPPDAPIGPSPWYPNEPMHPPGLHPPMSSPVPEPSTLWLVSLALIGAYVTQRTCRTRTVTPA